MGGLLLDDRDGGVRDPEFEGLVLEAGLEGFFQAHVPDVQGHVAGAFEDVEIIEKSIAGLVLDDREYFFQGHVLRREGNLLLCKARRGAHV